MQFIGENKNIIQINAVFIEDYIPDAPGDFVKAYLYALKCFQLGQTPTFLNMCGQLKLSPDIVRRAFDYWQDMGVIKYQGESDVTLEFLNMQPKKANHLYTHGEFNVTLQKIFGMRVLTPEEYECIYDFTDKFKLPQEVVILMLEYCVRLAGQGVKMNYIRSVANTWLEKGIKDIDTALEYTDNYDKKNHNASAVLKRLGITGRLPTTDEIALYNKWEKEMGFSLNAILLACTKTTSASRPSFKYLDSILKTLHKLGLVRSSDVLSHFEDEKVRRELIAQVKNALGDRTEITAFDRENYLYWTSLGLSHELILFGCKSASLAKNPKKYLYALMSDWAAKGIQTIHQAQQEIERNNVSNLQKPTVNNKVMPFEQRTIDVEYVRQKLSALPVEEDGI